MQRQLNTRISVYGGGCVTSEKGIIPLTTTELSIILTLALRAQPLSSSDILFDVWDGRSKPRCAEKNIPPIIYSIRKKSISYIDFSIVCSNRNNYFIDNRVEFEDFEGIFQNYQHIVSLLSTHAPASLIYEKTLCAVNLPFPPVLLGLKGKTINAYRSSYDQICHNLLSIKFDTALETGHHRDILPEVQAMYNIDKTNERYALQLIKCLARDNKRNEAFSVFFDCQAVLSETFGVDVCDDLKDAYLSLIS